MNAKLKAGDTVWGARFDFFPDNPPEIRATRVKSIGKTVRLVERLRVFGYRQQFSVDRVFARSAAEAMVLLRDRIVRELQEAEREKHENEKKLVILTKAIAKASGKGRTK